MTRALGCGCPASRQANRKVSEGHDLASYHADDLVRAAVERQFEVIGEALAQLARHSPDIVTEVPHWREAIGFHNVLIHGYA